MAISLHPDFKDFLKLLNSHNVDYLLIGGYAVGYHGYPRATADIDIWIAMNPQNAIKMVKVLKKFGFGVPELSVDLFLQMNKIVRLGNAPVRIEVLTSISGVDFVVSYSPVHPSAAPGAGILRWLKRVSAFKLNKFCDPYRACPAPVDRSRHAKSHF